MSRRKVVLYNPQAVFYTMSLALLAVGSALDPARYDVRIVDGRLEQDPIAAVLAEVEGALCLGMAVLTGAPIRDALRVARAVKARYPQVPVVWGGWHASLFPVETLEEPSIDITVQGQGEETFAELVDRLSAGAAPADGYAVAGTAERIGGRVERHPARPMRDMNSLPAHRYELLPVERFFALKGECQLDYISVDQVLTSAALCVRHGLGAIFPFIVGFPGESEASVQASLALVKCLRGMSSQFETPVFYFKPYPGSPITDSAVQEGYTLPATLDQWADFDFVGSSGPWVSGEMHERIERFKFYNRFAWGPETWPRRPLQALARWRCRRDFYRAPVEKLFVERLKPQQKLS